MSQIVNLPLEVILRLLEYVPCKNFIRLEQSNTKFKNIIRNVVLKTQLLKIPFRNIEKAISKHHFVSFDFSCQNITDEQIQFLFTLLASKNQNIVKLRLQRCNKITDKGLKFLTKCQKLDLSYTEISDEGLKYLGNCNFLRLKGCENIKGDGFKYLTNCKILVLSHCSQLDDSCLENLKNCHSLILNSCKKITDNGLKNLDNCRRLNLANCPNITNTGLQYLTSCIKIDLTGCEMINKFELLHLTKCQFINLSYCDMCDGHLKYLTNCVTVILAEHNEKDIWGQHKITNEGLKYLVNCQDLRLKSTMLVTPDVLKYLPNCKRLMMFNCFMSRIQESIELNNLLTINDFQKNYRITRVLNTPKKRYDLADAIIIRRIT